MGAPTFTGLWKMAAPTNPHGLAISVLGKIDLTHAQLRDLVDRAAALLFASGVGAGDVVALAFPNTVEFVILLPAVIRCRATAAPLNPTYTAEQFRVFLSRSGSKLLLTPQEGNQPAQSAASELNILHLTAKLHSADYGITLSSIDIEPSLDWISEVVNDPSDVALFWHSSGTTSPLLTQLDLAKEVQLYKREHKLTESNRNVIMCPLFYHDSLVTEFLSYLAAGAAVILPVDMTAKTTEENKTKTKNLAELAEVSGVRQIPYVEFMKENGYFAHSRTLGVGGSGIVYKGHIGDARTPVAVKILISDPAQAEKELRSELTLGQLRHKNLVRIVGYCCEANNLVLVYEFMREGSLDDHLFKGRPVLTWERRYKIAQGLASGLHYMHEGYDKCVIHRDIKSSNIMLDEEFNPKLADFGLARTVDHARGPKTTEIIGTRGYAAWEYCETGKASKESDVYSFGVVLLEIGSGKRAIDSERDPQLLVEWVWKQYEQGKLLSAVDSKLRKEFDKDQAKALMMTGLWCAHPIVSSRPSIKAAVDFLNLKPKPPKTPKKMPQSQHGIDPKVSPGCCGF